MAGAQALVAVPSSSGAWEVRTYNISGYALGEPGPIAFPASDLAAELGADGRVRVFGTLSLAAYGGAGVLNQVWQVGPAVTGASRAARHGRRQPRRQGEARPTNTNHHRRLLLLRRHRQEAQREHKLSSGCGISSK